MRRLLLLLTVFLFAAGAALRSTRGQEIAPPQIEVTPIPSVGSLVTIPASTHIDLPNLQTPNISDESLRRAISNLPRDAIVIEVKPATRTGKSQVLVRESDSTWRPAEEAPPITNTQPPPQPPVLWLTTTTPGKEYKLLTQLAPPDSGQNSWGWPEKGPFAINRPANIGALRGLLDSNPRLVIINNRGKLFPREWIELIKNSGRPYVIVTPESPNQGFLGIESAAKLGDQPVRPDAVRILSALPKLNGWLSGYLELHRMNLSLGQRAAWEQLLSQINIEDLPAPISEATRDSLQNELLYGNSDFVFVIAHNDGHFIYLPGSGGAISYDDLRSLQRSDAPNRTIILVTCNGGTLNASPRSLADLFLQNKLAKTVFASQTDVDANTVPALLRDLLAGGSDIRSILTRYGYYQFVFLLRPAWRNYPDG